jgi:hypothetical protein
VGFVMLQSAPSPRVCRWLRKRELRFRELHVNHVNWSVMVSWRVERYALMCMPIGEPFLLTGELFTAEISAVCGS